MLHTKFRGNWPAGSGVEDIEGFYHIWAWRQASCHQIFISLYMKAFIQSLIQIDTVVSEKIHFEIWYVHDLDLQYSHIFIYSIRCLLPLFFRSLAGIVSEKYTFFAFSHRKT